MTKLEDFEALAERVVETTFSRLFAGTISPTDVAIQLARAMEDDQVVAPDGTPQAPTHYWVYLHPEDHRTLTAKEPALDAKLASHVGQMAQQAELALDDPPVIRVLPSDEVAAHDVHVEARWMPQESPQGRTREMDGDDLRACDLEETIAPPGRPFLILEGRRHVDLVKPIISVGRTLDNDIIIEDPRVSRHHAQLRRRYGRYVLYDLDSSGGTQINSYPIEECVLQTGDVISLAGVQVIYSEDPPTPIPIPKSEDTPALGPQETDELEMK